MLTVRKPLEIRSNSMFIEIKTQSQSFRKESKAGRTVLSLNPKMLSSLKAKHGSRKGH